jgi:hypothetical protein
MKPRSWPSPQSKNAWRIRPPSSASIFDGHAAKAEHPFVEGSGGIMVERGKADV